MVKYTLEQQIFLYDSYVKNKFYKSLKRFLLKYSGIRVRASSMYLKLVKKCSTGCFLDKKYTKQNAVLTKAI
jgi:hypothetical protein